MELKDFIKGTITAIAESVKELNEELSTVGVVVNPRSAMFEGNINKMIHQSNGVASSLIHEIEFNLSVTQAKDTEAGGGIKIFVLSGGLNDKTKIENLNTVKFSIPIVLPSPKP